MEPGSTNYVKFHIQSHNESGNDIGALSKHSSGLQDLGKSPCGERVTSGGEYTEVHGQDW